MKSIVAQEIAKMGGAVPFAFEVTFADGTTYRNRDEPARFAAPATPAPQQSATTVVRTKKAPAGSGFDPYNSGSFERRNAWERVSKR